MISREQQLTSDIMRRVRFIHLGRYLLSPGMIKAMVFLASCVSALLMVSISSIIENMSHLPHFSAYFSYVLDSYMKTSWSVQSVMGLALVIGLWLVRDIAINLKGRQRRFSVV